MTETQTGKTLPRYLKTQFTDRQKSRLNTKKETEEEKKILKNHRNTSLAATWLIGDISDWIDT